MDALPNMTKMTDGKPRDTCSHSRVSEYINSELIMIMMNHDTLTMTINGRLMLMRMWVDEAKKRIVYMARGLGVIKMIRMRRRRMLMMIMMSRRMIRGLCVWVGGWEHLMSLVEQEPPGRFI